MGNPLRLSEISGIPPILEKTLHCAEQKDALRDYPELFLHIVESVDSTISTQG
jgi:hypothetical protein